MTATPAPRRGRPPLFVSQLTRATMQRGRLDPVYQELSDHWTTILQRLYPVWVLIGPGLSDPGHIEIHSRQIYLDSETLLGGREQIVAGRLERQAVLRCFGVAFHETFHAKHTKRWAVEHDLQLAESEHPEDRQLAADRQLLEEPRMEAHGVREHPEQTVRGRFVRRALTCAVTDVILPAFGEQIVAAAMAGRPVTRDMTGRAAVYLQARTHYGIVPSATLDGLRSLWRQVLGDADLQALEDLFARLIWIADGDLDALDRAAVEYREIIGEPDPDQSEQDGEAHAGAGAGDSDRGDGHGEGSDSGRGDARTTPAAGTLAEKLEQAINRARGHTVCQLDSDQNLDRLLAEAADSRQGRAPGGRGGGTGRPTGRMPDRGVDRPPAPDEIADARRYATRLRQALTAGTRRIDKRTPGGRFDGRAYTRATAQRQTGRPVSSHPWQITRQVNAPIQEPHVGLIIDTSGSMGIHEYALGPICWILTDGLRQVGGRVATALFGNSAELLSDGRAPMALVPGIRTGGGTAFAADAINQVADQLEMTNPRRPRFVYVISDGGWSDTQTGVDRIRRLAEHGVPTIHLSIGIQPLGVQCDRVHVIQDPAQALELIAAETVTALRTPHNHNRNHQ